MMEDTGEDILRAKPSPVTTFFRRIGQVGKNSMLLSFDFLIFNLEILLKRTTGHGFANLL
jgi:hypothetical protein